MLQSAEQAAQAGKWVAVMLSYEAAPAFDSAFITRPSTDLPLAWAAVFDQAHAESAWGSPGPYQVGDWAPRVTRAEYAEAIRRIHAYIEAGHTYQVNYTFPLQARFTGDEKAWFLDLHRSQRAAYSAYLDLGRFKILCLSPELFFERHGDRVVTRPMKGTWRRGRWLAEDEAFRHELASCPKNRAENLMIVDLLRNDLGRVAAPGSVRVPRLFEVERLETVLQMTSTVEAKSRAGLGFTDVVRALFPCGSITGAPKIRTMEIIRELEPFSRQVYTGAIGYLRPGGDAVFNVVIRTVLLDSETHEAVFGVGGGVTHDSTEAGEYDECLLKARFLTEGRPRFDLLESLLLADGEYFLLDRHLERLRSSAVLFRFRVEDGAVRQALEAVRQQHPRGRWKVRLLVGPDTGVRTEAQELPASGDEPVRVRLAPQPVDPDDPFLYNKTTHRAVYERMLKACSGCGDVLLWNTRGEVTESCYANVVIEQDGGKWTPPVACGLLAGTFRAELLARGEIRERVVTVDEVRRATGLYLINSVRKWRQAVLVDGP